MLTLEEIKQDRALINDINLVISENFVIFIDDFHLIDNQGDINKFISQFGQQMDEKSRRYPRSGFSHL